MRALGGVSFAVMVPTGRELSSPVWPGLPPPVAFQRWAPPHSNVELAFMGNCDAVFNFGFMVNLPHARARCGRAWASLSCPAAATSGLTSRDQHAYLCGFIDSFWGACIRCGQRMTPSADSDGRSGSKDQGPPLVRSLAGGH